VLVERIIKKRRGKGKEKKGKRRGKEGEKEERRTGLS
jgi:hypothetical protein